MNPKQVCGGPVLFSVLPVENSHVITRQGASTQAKRKHRFCEMVGRGKVSLGLYFLASTARTSSHEEPTAMNNHISKGIRFYSGAILSVPDPRT